VCYQSAGLFKSNGELKKRRFRYFGFESGGQSERTSMDLPSLWTVGAADFLPPASGKIALFSIAIELEVFSLPLPEVSVDDVVQLVSCCSLEGVAD
jgi:hypothetical protein